nr:ribonuclease HI family protein [Halapricum sp. CBA1109]
MTLGHRVYICSSATAREQAGGERDRERGLAPGRAPLAARGPRRRGARGRRLRRGDGHRNCRRRRPGVRRTVRPRDDARGVAQRARGPARRGTLPAADPRASGDSFVLYVDGSSRGNPGPAGAGAVIVDASGTELARLGRPVGSRAGNNTAEYVALQLGLSELLARYEPRRLEVRIDSMTVIRDVWGGEDPTEPGVDGYSEAVAGALSEIPAHRYTHLADSDPNPADALATVGADIAALGPG